MKIILNNNNEELSAETLTIQELLHVKKFTFKMLIIKINGNIIKRDSYESALVHDGDTIDVIHLISGG